MLLSACGGREERCGDVVTPGAFPLGVQSEELLLTPVWVPPAYGDFPPPP